VKRGELTVYKRVIKRKFDLFFSAIAIIILFIPFLIVAMLIKCDSKGPVFFRQQRMGKDSVPFKIYKFRSMYQGAPHNQATAELENADDQITRVGRLLRKTSIDELPQFINVFRGEMSIIGPRPVILAEKELIEMRQSNGADRVLPGLTGLAQVHGRDHVPNLKKANYDGIYAAALSFRTDVKICLRTIWYVLLHVEIHEGKQKGIEN
jgi:O-antigen biosynthesis protein WbqP